MAWSLSIILIPAAGTRFFIMLPSRASGNIIKRAQTIPASGLNSNSF
ncbi:MAG: hypothetical protein ACOVQC_00700 [Flavobacterium sp.]